MKKTLFLLFIYAVSAQVFGQLPDNSVHITWGEEFQEHKENSLNKIVGEDATGLYVVKENKGDYLLEFFGQGLKPIKSVEINLKKFGSKRKFEDIILFADKLCLLSSEFKLSKMTKYYYLQTVDKSSLLPNNDEFLVKSFKMKGYYLKHETLFNFSISDDKTKLLVYYDTPHDKLGIEKFGFVVLDKNMEEISSDFKNLSIKDNLFEIQRYKTDNNGDVFLLGKEYKDKHRDSRNGLPNFSYRLFANFGNGTELIDKELSLPGKYITDAQLMLLPDGKLVVTGFYSNEGTSSIFGSFYFEIDNQTHEITVAITEPMGIDLVTQNLKDREEEKLRKDDEKGENPEMSSYEIRDVLKTDDGGLILMGEQFFEEDKSSDSPSSGSHIKFVYNYNNILVLKMNAEGKVLWREKIGKWQKTINDNGYYSSYAWAFANGKLYCLFNDDPRNIENDGSGKNYNFKGKLESLAVLVRIGPDGGQERGILSVSMPQGILICPTESIQVNEGELIIFGNWKKNQHFARLVFQ